MLSTPETRECFKYTSRLSFDIFITFTTDLRDRLHNKVESIGQIRHIFYLRKYFRRMLQLSNGYTYSIELKGDREAFSGRDSN